MPKSGYMFPALIFVSAPDIADTAGDIPIIIVAGITATAIAAGIMSIAAGIAIAGAVGVTDMDIGTGAAAFAIGGTTKTGHQTSD